MGIYGYIEGILWVYYIWGYLGDIMGILRGYYGDIIYGDIEGILWGYYIWVLSVAVWDTVGKLRGEYLGMCQNRCAADDFFAMACCGWC